MPSAKAGQALIDAVGKTSGLTQVGLINSLGFRAEKRAVPALARLLTDQDAQVAAAAATALGQIGTSKALEVLQQTTSNSAGPVHTAVVDAWLRGANGLLAAGSPSKALPIFRVLYDTEKADVIRTAAYRGMSPSLPARGLPPMIHAILGQDGASQIAALQLVREVNAPNATRTFAVMLRKVEPPVQVALIEGLNQRGDVSAAPAIAAMVSSTSPEVRLAAIKALASWAMPRWFRCWASLPRCRTVKNRWPPLALVELRRGNPTETLLRLLPDAKPEVQAEFARAFGDRGDKAAVPRLVELARHGSGSAGKGRAPGAGPAGRGFPGGADGAVCD